MRVRVAAMWKSGTTITLSGLALLVAACGGGSSTETSNFSSGDVATTALVSSTDTSLFDDNACSLSSSGALTLSTLWMPKGDFSSSNTLDRTKTTLLVSGSIAAGTCGLTDVAPLSWTSVTDGNFTAMPNPAANNEIAYSWTVTGNLSQYQNHWYNHVACDGTMTVEGCQSARAVTFTIQEMNKKGSVKASDSIAFSLAAIQDASVIDQNCAPPSGPDCGIGACVSEAEHACDAQFPGNVNKAAREACKAPIVCACKALRPEGCSRCN